MTRAAVMASSTTVTVSSMVSPRIWYTSAWLIRSPGAGRRAAWRHASSRRLRSRWTSTRRLAASSRRGESMRSGRRPATSSRVAATSATTPRWVGIFLPISQGSGSTWITVVWAGSRTGGVYSNEANFLAPARRTTSASPSSAVSWARENPIIPRYWGWSVGKDDRTGSRSPYTRAPRVSAIRTRAARAAGVAAPLPAMSTGEREAARIAAMRSSTAADGRAESARSTQGAGPSTSSSRQSMGRERKTGPGDVAPRPHLVRPLGEVGGERRQVAPQGGLLEDHPPVHLPGRDHEGHAGPVVVEDVAEAVGEAGRNVEVHDGRGPRRLGVAVGHPHRDGVVQPQDVRDVPVLGEHLHEVQLGGPGVAEDVPDTPLAQHLEQRPLGLHGCLLAVATRGAGGTGPRAPRA